MKKEIQNIFLNWKPISLLNTDDKILTKILTKGLSIAMDKLTPKEQKCGVKGRQISEIVVISLE